MLNLRCLDLAALFVEPIIYFSSCISLRFHLRIP